MERKIVVKEVEDGVRSMHPIFITWSCKTAKMLHDLNVSQTVPEDLLLERLEKIEDHTGLCLTRCKKRQ